MAPPKPDSMAIDPFVDTIVNEDVTDVLPLTLDRDALRALDPASVLIARWPPPLKTKYLRNLLPELQISICPECLQVIFEIASHQLIYAFDKFLCDFRYFIRTIWNCKCCRRIIAHSVERIPKICWVIEMWFGFSACWGKKIQWNKSVPVCLLGAIFYWWLTAVSVYAWFSFCFFAIDSESTTYEIRPSKQSRKIYARTAFGLFFIHAVRVISSGIKSRFLFRACVRHFAIQIA